VLVTRPERRPPRSSPSRDSFSGFSLMRTKVVVVAAAFLLSGCASGASRSRDTALPAGVPDEQLRARALGAAANPEVAALNTRLLSHALPKTDDSDPVLGAGDLIEVSVFEVEELSKLKMRIPQRGVVRLPLLGAQQAAGRTVSEFEEVIRESLKKTYMHDPQVTVFVLENKSHTISVTGAVTKGGVHPLTSQLRVSDALALAEGLAPDAETTIYLVRRVSVEAARRMEGENRERAAKLPADGTVEVTVPIDLDALTRGQNDLNVVLQAGDVIHVPRANSYYVGGQVQRPGSFPLRTKTTLQQAISAAGGVKDTASWGDVRLYRVNANGQREIIKVDLDEIEENKAPAPELRKDDIVIVGKHYGKTALYEIRDFVRGVFSMGF